MDQRVSGFIFVWFLYLSVSYITGQGSHIRVKILDLFTPKRYIYYVDICMNFMWLGFNAFMTYYGAQLVFVGHPLSLYHTDAGYFHGISICHYTRELRSDDNTPVH